MPYRLGSDGSTGEIDCIHMVYAVLADLQIPTPPFQQRWYQAKRSEIARDLLRWGVRVETPKLDGDVLLLPGDKAFAVVWLNGALYIDSRAERVCWAPLELLCPLHCFRMRSSSAH